jgi:cytochrome c553
MTRLPLLLVLAACPSRNPDGAPDAWVYEPTCDNADGDVTIEGEVTWADDAGPIVMASCAGCHVDGGIAPFPLDSYAAAAPMAGAIAGAVEAKRMPPWPPASCGDCQTFQRDRSLSDEEIAILGAWAAQGAPEGGAADLSPTAPPALAREHAVVT